MNLKLRINELIQNSKIQNRRRRPIQNSKFNHGGLAQLARAPALQAGGQRFESVILHHPLKGKRSLTY